MADARNDKKSVEKINSLTKHVEGLKNRQASKIVGDKHKTRPQEYQVWVQRELTRTLKKIETLKAT